MILQLTIYNYRGRYIQLEVRPTAAMSLERVVVRSGRRCLWGAHRSHHHSKTETSPPSVWLQAVAESTGQYVFHVRTYCPETPSNSHVGCSLVGFLRARIKLGFHQVGRHKDWLSLQGPFYITPTSDLGHSGRRAQDWGGPSRLRRYEGQVMLVP